MTLWQPEALLVGLVILAFALLFEGRPDGLDDGGRRGRRGCARSREGAQKADTERTHNESQVDEY